jgi:hypothetical protein
MEPPAFRILKLFGKLLAARQHPPLHFDAFIFLGTFGA